MTAARTNRRRLGSRLAPYALILPGWLWLVIFFVVPAVSMLSVSTMTGNDLDGFKQTFHFGTYSQAWHDFHTQIVRSLLYGLIATAICVLIAYPVAYWIAFRGGKYKSSLLFLLLLPFFVSFVIRTQSWEFMLEDDGMVLRALRDLHLVGFMQDIGLVSDSGQILQTQVAVVGGLVYNFLPFAVLPIYVALERVEPALLEAAADLYASKPAAIRKVVLPLSLPGVFAAVLLTFVPASSDYVNSTILGGTNTTMIGNIIQTQYFTNLDYPTAASLSFILMGILLVGIFLYARALGTEDALAMAAAR
ncbi:MAG: spermidine/putrescine transport system permease protein [Pseudonocardiales bacterium]|jgi:spermidine/putrescine transport system permease protein|nr:spermidine/putrescine transport system permease protein [Pseudonocardiales bacterium]MDT4940249.1 spermidine/putrescine transport system permease protein [Pseudonocardiales bacterium]